MRSNPARRASTSGCARATCVRLAALAALQGATLFLAGCTTPPHMAVFDTDSALDVRSYQTRAFEPTDRTRTLRAVVATMQDLRFVIDKADANAGQRERHKARGL